MSSLVLGAQLKALGDVIDAKNDAGFGSIFAHDGTFTFGKSPRS
jgi:hypothetical protein